MWIVGCVYNNEVKPFYRTSHFKLARQMYLMLRGMGYKNVATNAFWEE